MTILITGATGKTGSCLAQLCKQADHSVLLTSRSGSVPEPFQGVRFEWLEPSTHENPFKIDGNIDRVYLVGPPMQNALPPMKEFIELALQKGVKRFVLLSGTASQKGSPGTGEIHKYLAERGGVEYAVLRPSWFFRMSVYSLFSIRGLLGRRSTWSETFSTDLRPGILNGDAIVSTTKDGRVPFVSVEDVADVAYKALVEEIPRNGEYIIVGPEIHSYDEVCRHLKFQRLFKFITGLTGRCSHE